MSISLSLEESRALARKYRDRGFATVPVPVGGKSPNVRGWPSLRLKTDAEIDELFNRDRLNVGAIMGAASGGLKDVDLDCKEAVALAPHFLPRTNSIYGRPGKQRSHYLYMGDDAGDPKARLALTDETKATIVELRHGGNGKAAQTVLPGSLHPSGERYAWHEDGPIATVPFPALKAAVTKIAVGTILMRHWPEGPHGRHELALGVGGFLARAGWSSADVEHLVDVVCRETDGVDWAHDHARTAKESAESLASGGQARGMPWMIETFGKPVAKHLAKLLGYRSRDAVEDPTPADGRPVIKVGTLTTTATEAERALVDAGVQFYERSNTMVRAIIKDVDAFHGGQTKTAQLVTVEQAYLRRKLSDVADWYRLDKRGKEWVAVDPPHDVCTSVIASSGDWPFPSIAGIVTTPTMRPDGTILAALGFDPATRLLMVDSPAMPPILDHPTREDALRALTLLEDLIVEFPFVDEVAKAGALSAIITPVARGAFPVVPMHVADAPRAGTGKSYLFNTVSIIATGQMMPVITAGGSEEELEKRLGSAVLAGQSLITIDNVTDELGGAAICQLVSEHRPAIRILGRTELVPVETRGMSMFANGNNITIVGDLCRRAIRVRLDARIENPETKTFSGDPVATVLADRGAYVAACLTICRAYVAAGRPGKLTRLASFEAWSDTVRSALVWLGKADPVESIDTSHAEDPERLSLAALHREWAAVFGTGSARAVTLKEVIEACEKRTIVRHGTPPEFAFDHPDLRSAVHGALRSTRQLDAAALGYWMRARKNRIVDGMWFEQSHTREGTKWWVERQSGANIIPAGEIPF
jgi:Bifunctional DNA primase/polymerase, N-terminal